MPPPQMAGLVGDARRLPDLPALVQDSDGDGLGDLGRDPARLPYVEPARGRRRCGCRRSTPPLRRLRLRRQRLHRRRPALRHARRLRRAARRRPRGGCACSWTSCRATRRSSTRGSASTPTATSGPTRAGPPNNWLAAFGGPAWSRDERGRRLVPALLLSRAARPRLAQPRGRARRWRTSSASGSAAGSTASARRARPADEGPRAARRPAATRAAPAAAAPRAGERSTRSTRATRPTSASRLAALREAAGDALLVGEVYLPAPSSRPYLGHLDVAFAFELFHAPWDAERDPRRARAPAPPTRALAWVLSNHDFSRLADRAGAPENVRAAALLLLTLPGLRLRLPGRRDRDGRRPRRRAAARPLRPRRLPPSDAVGAESPRRLHDRQPWLPVADPRRAQRRRPGGRPGSLLDLYRELIALRRELGGRLAICEADAGVLAFRAAAATWSRSTSARRSRARARGAASAALAAHGAARIATLGPGEASVALAAVRRVRRLAPRPGIAPHVGEARAAARRPARERSESRGTPSRQAARCRRWRLVAPFLAPLAACGADETAAAGRPQLVHLQRAQRRARRRREERARSESERRATRSRSDLPSDADQQREQLVRRLGAEDDSIDIIGMDVIWTAEFANAGWIKPWTGADEQAATRGHAREPARDRRLQGQALGGAERSNTQLLWYRKDRVKTAAEDLGRDDRAGRADRREEGLIEVQATATRASSSGSTRWSSRPATSIVEPDDGRRGARAAATRAGARMMDKLASSAAADPAISTSEEDTARLAFEGGNAAFMVNYPFVYPSAKEERARRLQEHGRRAVPGVDPSKPAAPPLGGINLGVRRYSKHPKEAFEATCLIAAARTRSDRDRRAGCRRSPRRSTTRRRSTRSIPVRRPDPAADRERGAAAARRPPTRTSRWRSSATIHPLDGRRSTRRRDVEELRENVETRSNVEGAADGSGDRAPPRRAAPKEAARDLRPSRAPSASWAGCCARRR